MNKGSLKKWADSFKRNAYALYLAGKDQRVPFLAKFVIFLTVCYALSPIDLIPDFVPLLGYLDDMVLLPLAIALAIRMIPPEIWEDCRNRAQMQLESGLPCIRTAGIVIVMIWVAGFSAAMILVLQVL